MKKDKENEKINKEILKKAKETDLTVTRVDIPPYKQRVALDMSNLYLNIDSPLHCDTCKERLGVCHTLRYALFKRRGTVYFVPCKKCGKMNERTKGEYKQTINAQWKDFGKDETGK